MFIKCNQLHSHNFKTLVLSDMNLLQPHSKNGNVYQMFFGVNVKSFEASWKTLIRTFWQKKKSGNKLQLFFKIFYFPTSYTDTPLFWYNRQDSASQKTILNWIGINWSTLSFESYTLWRQWHRQITIFAWFYHKISPLPPPPLLLT